MRAYLLNAPRWGLGVVHGVLFGAVMAVVGLLRDETAPEALARGVFSGTVFGLLMAASSYRQDRRLREAVDGLPPRQQQVALRAVARGPVPDEPEVRAAALRLAERQLAANRRFRTVNVVLFGGLLMVAASLAVTGSPWWWLGVALWSAALAGQVWTGRRLEQRVALLSPA